MDLKIWDTGIAYVDLYSPVMQTLMDLLELNPYKALIMFSKSDPKRANEIFGGKGGV